LEGGRFLTTNAAGEVYLASSFVGSVDFGSGPLVSTEGDFALTKLDACGNVLWAKNFGANGSNVRRDFSGVTLDPQGNVLLGGGYYGSINLGGGVQNGNPDLANGSGYDIFVAKLDTSGKHVWSKTLSRMGDGGGTGSAFKSAFAPDGTIYVSGSSGPATSHTIDFGAGPVTFDDDSAAWITRFTPTGTALSTSKFEHVSTHLATTPSGKVIAVGQIRDTADLGTGPLVVNGPNGPTSPTAYLAEFAPDGGGALWLKAFGTKNPPRFVLFPAFAVTETTIGIAGQCATGIDIGAGTPCSGNYTFFARYDLNGNFISAAQHPIPTYAGTIATTPTNQFVVAGSEGDTPGAPGKVTVTKFAP
jgi:hypothetical protein